MIDLLVTAIFTGVYLAWEICGSRTGLCAGLFNFGLPLNGFACFALGLVVADSLCASEGPSNDDLPLTKFIRRQLMPAYILHDAVIISISWGAKFIGCFAALKTLPGDIVMWFVAILVAILLGELLRRFRPSASSLLFGGR